MHEEDCFVANGKLVNQLATPKLREVGYIGKGDVERENILGMRILQTRWDSALAYPLHGFFPTLVLCDTVGGTRPPDWMKRYRCL